MDAFAADLSSQAEVRRLAREVLDKYPRLDVLINNVASTASYDSAAGRHLWEVSTDLVGLTSADSVRRAGRPSGAASLPQP